MNNMADKRLEELWNNLYKETGCGGKFNEF